VGTRTAGGATVAAGPVSVTLARGITAQYEPLEPTAVFLPSSNPIYLTFTANGAGANARLRTVWIATNVGSAAPAGTVLDEASVTLPRGTESGAFNLKQTGGPWAVGDYRLDVYLNDALLLSAPFTIQ